MKKVFLLATAALLITGVSFADGGKKKKCAKGKTCESKTETSGKTILSDLWQLAMLMQENKTSKARRIF